MPDPRLAVSFTDVDVHYTTFIGDNSTILYDATKTGGSASINLAVTLSADGTVALAADGDRVIGKLIAVESDNRVNVQDRGYMTLPGGASATLTRSGAIVGALGASSAKGYIRAAASGTAAELVKCAGFIVSNTTTTAVVVKL